jgi:imidazolonepropionase
MWDTLLLDCHAATMRQKAGDGFGTIRDAAIAINNDGRIAWIGRAKERPTSKARRTRRLDGAWVTPGLIDCHTHMVFGGERIGDWRKRQSGSTYEEISASGGGILSTVRATRAASEVELLRGTLCRVRAMAAHGVTTIEIKSGYGLDFDTEAKMLRVAKLAGARGRVRVARTFLGAHAIPPEYKARRSDYVDLICDEMIPKIARAKLAEACDAFCESFAFTPAEVERVLGTAKKHNMSLKLHGEQMSNQGSAALASRLGALSVDHLEHLDAKGIRAMAEAGTVAVLLPCAHYFMRETKMPPIDDMRRAGVAMAVATDCNPGTSPTVSPLLALNMACVLFRLTPEEALAGMTRHAAKALGLQESVGTLEIGKIADLAVWNVSEPSELAYWLGADLLRERYYAGRSGKVKSP